MSYATTMPSGTSIAKQIQNFQEAKQNVMTSGKPLSTQQFYVPPPDNQQKPEGDPTAPQVQQRSRMYGSTGPFNNSSSGHSSRRFVTGELMNTTHGSHQQ